MGDPHISHTDCRGNECFLDAAQEVEDPVKNLSNVEERTIMHTHTKVNLSWSGGS